jgi:hypothetical protein
VTILKSDNLAVSCVEPGSITETETPNPGRRSWSLGLFVVDRGSSDSLPAFFWSTRRLLDGRPRSTHRASCHPVDKSRRGDGWPSSGRWLAGTIAGMLYSLVIQREYRLSHAVLSHATTNAMIAAHVLIMGSWSRWKWLPENR